MTATSHVDRVSKILSIDSICDFTLEVVALTQVGRGEMFYWDRANYFCGVHFSYETSGETNPHFHPKTP